LLAAGLTAGGMTVYTSEPWSEIRGFRWPSTVLVQRDVSPDSKPFEKSR